MASVLADYKIEKGIPAPGSTRGIRKYPFGDMEVGDSVLIPDITITKVSNALTNYKRKGLDFTSRTVEGGVRTWRIA